MSDTETSPDLGSVGNDAPPGSSSADDGGSASIPAGELTRRGRLRKWDRPPPPHDWRWYVGGLGKVLIAVGLLMFGFVAYQLYGTGLQTAAAQNRLENEFEDLLADTSPVTAPSVEIETTLPVPEPADEPAPTTTVVDEAEVEAVPVENQNLVQVENGDALARIEIPEIGVDDIVVAGVDKGDLQKGPGHFPDTPMPGQLGNSAIAGHRTTYGQPFRNVDQLEPGDEIRVTTLSGTFVYSVTGTTIVPPSYYQAVATTDPTIANLTLTSCHPVFTARERIVISSELVVDESSPVGEPVLNYGRTPDPAEATDTTSTSEPATTDVPVTAEAATDVPATDAEDPAFAQPPADNDADSDQLGTEAVNEGIADAFSESWFSDPGANAQVGLWGLALSAIALASYWVSRRLRRDWAGLLVGIVPFTVALYFFFQNVNRLLPPNL
ncbi:class E sortase [Ilumatobacter nonamiensis]|uniref:class E sortase n=1 Tax=Ilumatobacter nonamiensis TaxID=467093 RepID=UPI00034CAB28|nr:class E sortase [Ilumatobacter nonamiensis]